MPSRGQIVDVEEKDNEFLVVVKIRGVGTKDWSNPVAKRAKLAAAREVGIIADYVPTTISQLSKGENINEMLEGKWLGEIKSMRTLRDGLQQTVLYGVKLKK